MKDDKKKNPEPEEDRGLSVRASAILAVIGAIGTVLFCTRRLLFSADFLRNNDEIIGGWYIIALCLLAYGTLGLWGNWLVSAGEAKRRKSMLGMKKSNASGKQYAIGDVAKMVREQDVIELKVMTLYGVRPIGSASDCKPNSFEFFDKVYFIGDKEYPVENEQQFLNDIVSLWRREYNHSQHRRREGKITDVIKP